MDWFKCLFCLEQLKDSDLICNASCDHFIHEWCVEAMKAIEDRQCKLCEKNIMVQSVFREFDLERAVQVKGLPMMIQKLDNIIELMWDTTENAVAKFYDFFQLPLIENVATQKQANCRKTSTRFLKNSSGCRSNIEQWSLRNVTLKSAWNCWKMRRKKTKLTSDFFTIFLQLKVSF